MTEQIKLFCINFAVSGCAAALSKTLVSPLERTKLILQNQELALQVLRGEVPKYKGIIDCLIRLPKEQGILSYWRGNGANIMRYVPLQALNFSFFNLYNNILKNVTENHIISLFSAGGLAGLTSIVFVFPLDFCTTRLAVDFGTDSTEKNVPKREFTGLFHCINKVRKVEGFLGLYSGFSCSAIGLTIYRCFYFGLFEIFKKNYNRHQIVDTTQSNLVYLFVQFLAAQTITMFSGWIAYPFDTAGRRMMMESSRPKKFRTIKSMFHSFKLIYKNEGITGFYKGAIANAMRSTGGALVLVFYDEILYHSNLYQTGIHLPYQKAKSYGGEFH